MKTFTFLAKQGQHNQIARLLTATFGKPKLTQYSGPRGLGVLVSLILPQGVSKRTVNRTLFGNNVPGAVSCRNKLLIVKAESWDTYKIADKVGYDTPFILARDGKLQRAELVYVDYGCSCCGGYQELRFA